VSQPSSVASTPEHNTPTSARATVPTSSSSFDFSGLEKMTREELLASLKKTTQTAARYKGRFAEVRNE